MKKIYKSLALSLLTVSGLLITSCNDDETLTREGKPTVTLTENTIQAYEGFGSYLEFDFTYDLKEVAEIRIEVVGGTATEGDDYTFNIPTIESAGGGYYGGEGYFGRLSAYSQKAFLLNYIRIINDGVSDPNETIELKITSVANGTILIDETATVVINEQDILDPSTLDIELDFTRDLTVDGTTYAGCDIDMDLYVFDNGNDAANATDLGHSWYDCPEAVQINNNPATFGSANGGLLYVWADLWDRGPVPAPDMITNHEDIVMDLNFTKTTNGNQEFLETTVIDHSFDTLGVPNSGPSGSWLGARPIAKVFLTGDKYIVLNIDREDANNNLVAIGKMANTIHPKANAVK